MIGELIVSSTDEITRERLEAEATLLDSVVRETECEAVTEREDTYEVIIDSGDGKLTGLKYALGKRRTNFLSTEYKKATMITLFTVSHVEDTSVLEIIPYKDAPASLTRDLTKS